MLETGFLRYWRRQETGFLNQMLVRIPIFSYKPGLSDAIIGKSPIIRHATGKELATFTGEAEMLSCAIAPDGVTVVAGNSVGRVYFLRLQGMRETGFLGCRFASEVLINRLKP